MVAIIETLINRLILFVLTVVKSLIIGFPEVFFLQEFRVCDRLRAL